MIDILKTNAGSPAPPKQNNAIIGVNRYLKCPNCIKFGKYSQYLLALINKNHIFHYWRIDYDKKSILSAFWNNFNIFCKPKDWKSSVGYA